MLEQSTQSGGHHESGLILEVLSREYLKTFQLLKAQECLTRWLEREPELARQLGAWRLLAPRWGGR